jgi:DNA-binding NtrC family response regulator
VAASDGRPLDDLTAVMSPARKLSPESAAAFVFEVIDGPDRGLSFHLDASQPSRAYVGKSPICQLRLSDPTVSRRHLAIDPGDRLRLTDLGSTNGTVVNGVHSMDAFLEGTGEIVQIGGTTIRVQRAAPTLVQMSSATSFGRVFGASPEMRRLYPLCERLASSDVPLIIEGETGTGKELLAEALHDRSVRAKEPFVVFDCTAVPPSLLEATLFGHERGAFTGAVATNRGLLQQADGGTLLVDEIGELDVSLQPKLLRAIERSEFRRVGGNQWITINVRIMAATRRNLDLEIQAGRFRDDLFYRLSIVRLHIPPLRERRVEIPSLANHYLRKHAKEYGKGDLRLSEDTMEYLVLYKWPGNVRQLASEMRRLAALAESDAVLMPEHLSREIAASRRTIPASERVLDSTEVVVRLDQPMAAATQHLEQAMLQYALKKCGGRVEETAAMLGISRKGLYLKRLRFGIDPPAEAPKALAG